MPKFKLVGQRYAHETSTLCSNLYFVYQGRLTGVKVPAHGAEFFNKKLSKLIKKSKGNELILTAAEVDELINRWKADDVRCANAGTLFPMRDNLLKFLQGGNRPDSIQSVILMGEVGYLNPHQCHEMSEMICASGNKERKKAGIKTGAAEHPL